VLAAHLLSLVRGIAPVLPHMAEDAWSHLPFSFLQDDGSMTETVFEAAWPKVDERWRSISKEDLALWSALLQVFPSPMNTHDVFRSLCVQVHTADLCDIAYVGDSCSSAFKK